MDTETTDTHERKKIPPAKAWRNFVVLFVLLLGIGGATYWWGAYKTYHFEAVTPGVLYRSGNQGMREFATAVNRSHSKTIVCLIDDNEWSDPNKPQFEVESVFADRNHVNFIRLPVKLGGWPTTDDVRKFLDVVTDPANQPVLVHCAQGVRRTGMFVAAYEMSVLGYDKSKAVASIDAFGHSDKTINDVKRFIEVYDPATRSVTKSLAQSSE